MSSLRIKRRALTLATRGILSGAAITLATHGLIQLPVEVPVQVTQLPAVGGASYNEIIYGVPYRHVSKLVLYLSSDAYAYLKQHEPLDLVEPAREVAIARFNADDQLVLVSDTKASFFDWQKHDDEDVILLLAAKMLWG